MQIRVSNLERLTLAEMTDFVASNQGIDCQATDRQAVYGVIERGLKNQGYSRLRKSQRGVVRAFLLRVTGAEPGAADTSDPALAGHAEDRTQTGAAAELQTALCPVRH